MVCVPIQWLLVLLSDGTFVDAGQRCNWLASTLPDRLNYIDAVVGNTALKPDGMMNLQSAYIVMMLSQVQHRAGVFGSVGEIGVYKGLFYSALALTVTHGERLFACDLFREVNVSEFAQNVGRFGIDPSCITIRKQSSVTLTAAALRRSMLVPFRLLSIDGSHDVEPVVSDLRLAAAVLADGGVVVLDDFSQDAWLTVREGLYRFLFQPDGPSLAPFLMACNKLYMTTSSHHQVMFEATLSDRGLGALGLSHLSNRGIGPGTIISGWRVAIPMVRRTVGAASPESVLLGCEDLPVKSMIDDWRDLLRDFDAASPFLRAVRHEKFDSETSDSEGHSTLVSALPHVRRAAWDHLAHELRRAEFVRIPQTRAAKLAHELLAIQVAECPTIEAFQQAQQSGINHNIYGPLQNTALVKITQENLNWAKACLPSTTHVRALLHELHGHLRATAQIVLAALAEFQSRAEGPVAVAWLRDALDVGGSGVGGAHTLLRSVAYGAEIVADEQGGSVRPTWTEQAPHQDSAWISLIVESRDGLYMNALDDASKRIVSAGSELLVLAGGFLFEASGGFWPAACHGVAAIDSSERPRFSWVFQMVRHERYGGVLESPKLPMGSCPLSGRHLPRESVLDQWKDHSVRWY